MTNHSALIVFFFVLFCGYFLLFMASFLNFASASALSSDTRKIHHRDTENTEEHRAHYRGDPDVRPPAKAGRSQGPFAPQNSGRPDDRTALEKADFVRMGEPAKYALSVRPSQHRQRQARRYAKRMRFERDGRRKSAVGERVSQTAGRTESACRASIKGTPLCDLLCVLCASVVDCFPCSCSQPPSVTTETRSEG